MTTDEMPVFTIKAKDDLAMPTLIAYRRLCLADGLGEQAEEVQKALHEIYQWRERNPDLCKQPDHQHVPVRSALTTDHNDPRLTHGVDAEPAPQAQAYLVLPEEERAKGFVRPVRRSYWHLVCRVVTTMSQALAETYAREPGFYGSTYCTGCGRHLPVSEFLWDINHNETDPVVGS